MRNKTFISFSVLLIITVFFIFSQEQDDATKSITHIREEKLKYGLNNEIIELLGSLIEEKNTDHNSTLKDIFAITKNTQIKELIIKLFSAADSPDLLELSAGIVKNRDYENKNLVITSLKYLSEKGNNKYNSLFEELLTDINPEYKIESVKALTGTKDKKYTDKLIQLYTDEDDENVRLAVLLDIGKLEDSSAVDFLIEIARDMEKDRTSRQYALNSLGEIKDEKSFDDLLAAFQENDPLIRIYAVAAISKFNKPEVNQVIHEALKDENWRIRKEAVISAGKTENTEFIDILIYRTNNDPVEEIRIESVKALGNISGIKAFDFLREKAVSKLTPFRIRRTAFNVIINNDLNQSLDTIEQIINDEWTSANKAAIETFCSELAFVQSRKLDFYFEKMLGHSSISVRISGLRGIKLNKISSLKDKVELLTTPGNPLSIRNHALAVLEAL